nr:MAG TPA: YvrJ protein family protein [Caudoviricetes sp.]
MDVQTIMQIITTVGFPICVCIICFWYINKQTEVHKEETKALTDAVNNNTTLLHRLLDKLGGDHEL